MVLGDFTVLKCVKEILYWWVDFTWISKGCFSTFKTITLPDTHVHSGNRKKIILLNNCYLNWVWYCSGHRMVSVVIYWCKSSQLSPFCCMTVFSSLHLYLKAIVRWKIRSVCHLHHHSPSVNITLLFLLGTVVVWSQCLMEEILNKYYPSFFYQAHWLCEVSVWWRKFWSDVLIIMSQLH